MTDISLSYVTDKSYKMKLLILIALSIVTKCAHAALGEYKCPPFFITIIKHLTFTHSYLRKCLYETRVNNDNLSFHKYHSEYFISPQM